MNKPYIKNVDENGKVTDIFPYLHQSKETRNQRRGYTRIGINSLGQVIEQRRVASSKTKNRWI